jgi:hypothetical protein
MNCHDPTPPRAYVSDGAPAAIAGRWAIEIVRLDPRGRDRIGRWWGRGQPLYWFCSPCAQIQGYTRARRRAHAKAIVQARCAFAGPIPFAD